MNFIQVSNQPLRYLLIALFLIAPASLSSTPLPQSPPNIGIETKLAADRIKRGRTVQGIVTMDIPSGYHVNSNRPLEKYLIPTHLQVNGPKGVKIGPSLYPRPLIRSVKFSKNKVAVFEGRTPIRFAVTVPAGFSNDSVELKVSLRYQSCSDDVCFPSRTREFTSWLKVE